MNHKNTRIRVLLRKISIFAMLALACPVCAMAGKAPQLKILQSGPYRVLYYTEGPLAVDPTDVNENGIPDRVEDCLTSIIACRLLYCKLLGYPDPLNAGRLPKVRFIDIRLQPMKDSEVLGNAARRISFPNDIPNNPRGAGSLVIHIQAEGGNHPYATPHEFFHLVQYAATYCGKGWFTEGTAIWSTDQGILLGKGKGWVGTVPLDHWPLTRLGASTLFEMKYEASKYLWNRLALLCDNDGEIPRGPVFEELKAMKYADGSPVLKGTKLVGWRLMRDILFQLSKIDGNKNVWHDDDAILRAVEKAAAGYLPKQMSDKSVPVRADIETERTSK